MMRVQFLEDVRPRSELKINPREAEKAKKNDYKEEKFQR